MAFTELKSIFSSVGTIELLMFFFNMLFFLGANANNQLWYLVLNLFHVSRGGFGILLARLIPNTHEIVEKVEFYG